MTDSFKNNLPPLSRRLQAIVSLVSPCKTAADIGCDHGYVSIALCLLDICERGIASDIKEGPADRARSNAQKYDVADRIDIRTGTGLSTLGEEEADSIIISGMGGEMMLSILEEGFSKACAAKELILGPQSEVSKVRDWLSARGFEISDEKLIKEGGKYYPLIRVNYSSHPYELTTEEKLYGPVLIRNRDAILKEFLKYRNQALKEILSGIRDSQSERTSGRYKELSEEREMIRKVQKSMAKDCFVILASASPRRAELMHQIGYDPVIVPADVDENIGITEPAALVQALSEKKCLHIAERIPEMESYQEQDGIIIAADTIVTLDGEILGKPADEEDAFRMLRRLSGRTHEVLTGVCAVSLKKGEILENRSFVETTKVTVCNLSDQEIREYIETGEPSDKAGAYGIQGVFAKFIVSIEGNYANVVGLPVSTLYQTMKGMIYELQRDPEKNRRRFSPRKRRRLG